MRIPATCLALIGLTLSACSDPPPSPPAGEPSAPVETPTPSEPNMVRSSDKPATDAYLGRWTGVEGMYLVIDPGPAPGRYRLEMQWDLDHKGVFEGTAVGDTIAFTREGVPETLAPTGGEATGLKYLADKTDCLTVKAGEGYCRD